MLRLPPGISSRWLEFFLTGDPWLGANLSSESEYFSLRRETIPRSGIVRSRAARAVEGLASLLVFGGVISV